MPNSNESKDEPETYTITVSTQPWKRYLSYFQYRFRQFTFTLVIAAIGSKYRETVLDILFFVPDKLTDGISVFVSLDVTTQLVLVSIGVATFIAVHGGKRMRNIELAIEEIEDRIDEIEDENEKQ